MDIVRLTYEITSNFPENERFALSVQCQKSAVSIPSNIAEGCSRKSSKDQYRFTEIALGSAFELETQILIAQSLGYASSVQYERILEEINQEQRMLSSYMEKLKA